MRAEIYVMSVALSVISTISRKTNGREGRSIIQIIYISSQTQYIANRTH